MKSPHLKFEKEVWAKDGIACGIDEVGRGCIAGPVVACAISFPCGHKRIKNVRDSKKLTPKMRKEIYEKLLTSASDFGIGLVSPSEIDSMGIAFATKKAMKLAFDQLSKVPDVALIDAFSIEEIEIKQKAIIRGDECVYSIAAASIVAKVFRDAIVSGFDNIYPDYSFSRHKGYGTKIHYEALHKNGLTPEHRKTFILGKKDNRNY